MRSRSRTPASPAESAPPRARAAAPRREQAQRRRRGATGPARRRQQIPPPRADQQAAERRCQREGGGLQQVPSPSRADKARSRRARRRERIAAACRRRARSTSSQASSSSRHRAAAPRERSSEASASPVSGLPAGSRKLAAAAAGTRGAPWSSSWSRGRGMAHRDDPRQARLLRVGIGAQRDHAVAQVDGLVEVVRDEEHREAALAHQAGQLVLQDPGASSHPARRRARPSSSARAPAPGSARSARAAACRPTAAAGTCRACAARPDLGQHAPRCAARAAPRARRRLPAPGSRCRRPCARAAGRGRSPGTRRPPRATARRIGRPSRRTAPPLGCTQPAAARSSVVLPQPEGPTMQTNSPRAHLERGRRQDLAPAEVDRDAVEVEQRRAGSRRRSLDDQAGESGCGLQQLLLHHLVDPVAPAAFSLTTGSGGLDLHRGQHLRRQLDVLADVLAHPGVVLRVVA